MPFLWPSCREPNDSMLVGKSEVLSDGEQDWPHTGTVGDAEWKWVPKARVYSDEGDRTQGGKSIGGLQWHVSGGGWFG
jgi:hypothetical protein